MLRLGLFDNFKPENNRTILLSGSGRDMETLVDLLDPVLSGKQESIALHDRVSVAPNHPVKLFAVRSLPKKTTTDEFFLLCSPDLSFEIRDKIEPLISSQDSHQYFDLAHTAATLMVSVGEYDDSWWTTHG